VSSVADTGHDALASRWTPPDSAEMVEAVELSKNLPLAEGDVVSGDAACANGPVVKASRSKGADYFLFVKAAHGADGRNRPRLRRPFPLDRLNQKH
jgi:hypothetical protein